MFAKVKKELKDYVFKTKEETAVKISELMFELSSIQIETCFRKSLNNMVEFWKKLPRESLIS